MIDVLAVTAIISAFTAALCGHASQPFPPARWWRRARARHQRTQTRRHTTRRTP